MFQIIALMAVNIADTILALALKEKLTQEQISAETKALAEMGHKRIAIEAGEDDKNCPIDYILECMKTVYNTKSGNGEIRRINVNIAATSVENYKNSKMLVLAHIYFSRKHIISLPMRNITHQVRKVIMITTNCT